MYMMESCNDVVEWVQTKILFEKSREQKLKAPSPNVTFV